MTDDLPPELSNISPMNDEFEKSTRTITIAVYALQAASLVFGITAIIAIILNYVKLSDVQGTRYESHFHWQIRTFWFGLLWTVVSILLVFAVVGWIGLLVVAVWFIYRIVKGWVRLIDGKEMYVTP